jgi:Helix-turn-helix domain
MIKLYKFRIYPNREQIQTPTQTIEICRLLYNDPLEQRRKDAYACIQGLAAVCLLTVLET